MAGSVKGQGLASLHLQSSGTRLWGQLHCCSCNAQASMHVSMHVHIDFLRRFRGGQWRGGGGVTCVARRSHALASLDPSAWSGGHPIHPLAEGNIECGPDLMEVLASCLWEGSPSL